MSDSLKILISDDSILARKQLKDVILKHTPDVTFVEASNGQEAIDRYRDEQPDMVFLDIVMPQKDGIEATKGIMELNNKADIIIVSSVGTKMQLKAAIEAGARDFIQKPMNPAQVESVLESHLGGR